MRKITYKTLKIQNFLSVGNDTVEINFQNGLNLITGKNIDNPERKNAVGKSVLIDAFYYALFGKTIREIKKAFIINNVTKGSGELTLEFDVETEDGIQSYRIVRTLKPSAAALFQGDTDITNDSIANTNESICKLIGSNSVICKSCDILSLSDNTPFMAKDAKDKRRFIEDIFALEIYGSMSEALKKLIKANKTDSAISSTKLDEMVNSLNLFLKQKQDIEKAIAEKEENLSKRKALLVGKRDEYKEQLTALVITDVSSHSTKIENYKLVVSKLTASGDANRAKLATANANAQHAVKEIEKLCAVDGQATCDKCGQIIPHTHVELLTEQKREWHKKKGDYRTESGILRDKGEEIYLKIEKANDIIKGLQQEVTASEKAQAQKEYLEKIIREVEEAIQNIEEDSKDNAGSIQVIEDSLNDVKRRKDLEDITFADLKQTGDDLETCKFILGEEGVKAFVVKKLLGMLNSSIQTYINDLGMTMKCKFDEYFEEQITNEKGKEISYWNFSGGERRTVDLACAWAFKDIKRKISGVSSNVEFCDEIFDSAFDERGLDLLIEVLKGRIDKYKMSIYAISHRKETMKHIDGEIVALEKENGVTRRVDSQD